MQIVLAWGARSSFPEIDVVEFNLLRLYQELFSLKPRVRKIKGIQFNLLALEIPVSGWLPSHFEKNKKKWAYCVDFPFNARSVCMSSCFGSEGQDLLLPVAYSLEDSAFETLSRLSPHFALFWGDLEGRELNIQMDGLGFCQLYNYSNGDAWAISNKVSAFKGLGLSVQPDPSQFAIKFALRGFPNQLSGFKHIRQLLPGERLKVLDQSPVLHESTVDVLNGWTRSTGLLQEESLELGRRALIQELQAVEEFCEKPILAGLTGGRDTRAIVSSLLASSVDFRLRVRGRMNSYDVRVAKELANVAGLPLVIESDDVFPPGDVDGLEQAAKMAVLWQGGHQLPNLLKMFRWADPKVDGGFANLMGQHGEIARGMYEMLLKFEPPSYPDGKNEELIFNMYSASAIGRLRNSFQRQARDEFHIAYNQRADMYGLYGWRRCAFFNLFQHTRRYVSGGHYAQKGQVITPFLSVDFIRASFNHPVEMLRFSPIHKYIVKVNYEPWSYVQYDKELMANENEKRKAVVQGLREKFKYYSGQFLGGRRAWSQPYRGEEYIPWRYWRIVGEPLVKKSLERGGLWEEVFDPDQVFKAWESVADELLLLYALEEVYD